MIAAETQYDSAFLHRPSFLVGQPMLAFAAPPNYQKLFACGGRAFSAAFIGHPLNRPSIATLYARRRHR